MRALLDTNVIVDVLQNRMPWAVEGQKIFMAAANEKFSGFVTAKEIADIHYFVKKSFRGQDNVDMKARQIINKLLTLFDILDTRNIDCRKAILSDCRDYEDAIMIETAVRTNMDCIVTRNINDYSVSPINVFLPSDFLSIIL